MIRDTPAGVEVDVKVVPNASRQGVVGVLGDRLKVAVKAPPEKGKANRAVAAVLAEALGVSAKNIEVTAGLTQPRKTVRIASRTAAQARDALGL